MARKKKTQGTNTGNVNGKNKKENNKSEIKSETKNETKNNEQSTNLTNTNNTTFDEQTQPSPNKKVRRKQRQRAQTDLVAGQLDMFNSALSTSSGLLDSFNSKVDSFSGFFDRALSIRDATDDLINIGQFEELGKELERTNSLFDLASTGARTFGGSIRELGTYENVLTPFREELRLTTQSLEEATTEVKHLIQEIQTLKNEVAEPIEIRVKVVTEGDTSILSQRPSSSISTGGISNTLDSLTGFGSQGQNSSESLNILDSLDDISDLLGNREGSPTSPTSRGGIGGASGRAGRGSRSIFQRLGVKGIAKAGGKLAAKIGSKFIPGVGQAMLLSDIAEIGSSLLQGKGISEALSSWLGIEDDLEDENTSNRQRRPSTSPMSGISGSRRRNRNRSRGRPGIGDGGSPLDDIINSSPNNRNNRGSSGTRNPLDDIINSSNNQNRNRGRNRNRGSDTGSPLDDIISNSGGRGSSPLDDIINIGGGSGRGGILTNIVGGLGKLLPNIGGLLKNIAGNLAGIIKNVISGIADALTKVFSGIFDIVTSIGSALWGIAKNVVSTAMNLASSAISTIWNGIKALASGIVDIIKAGVGMAMDMLKEYAIDPMFKAAEQYIDTTREISKEVGWNKSSFENYQQGLSGMIDEFHNKVGAEQLLKTSHKMVQMGIKDEKAVIQYTKALTKLQLAIDVDSSDMSELLELTKRLGAEGAAAITKMGRAIRALDDANLMKALSNKDLMKFASSMAETFGATSGGVSETNEEFLNREASAMSIYNTLQGQGKGELAKIYAEFRKDASNFTNDKALEFAKKWGVDLFQARRMGDTGQEQWFLNQILEKVEENKRTNLYEINGNANWLTGYQLKRSEWLNLLNNTDVLKNPGKLVEEARNGAKVIREGMNQGDGEGEKDNLQKSIEEQNIGKLEEIKNAASKMGLQLGEQLRATGVHSRDIQKGIGLLTQIVSVGFGVISSLISGLIPGFVKDIAMVGMVLYGAMRIIGKDVVVAGIKGIASWMMDVTVDAIKGLGSYLITRLLDFGQATWKAIQANGSSLLEGFGEWFGNIFNEVFPFLKNLVLGLGEYIVTRLWDVTKALVEAIANNIKSLLEGIKILWDASSKWLESTFDQFSTFFAKVMDSLGKYLGGWIDYGVNLLKNDIKKSIADMVTSLFNAFDDLGDVITDAISNLVKGIATLVPGAESLVKLFTDSEEDKEKKIEERRKKRQEQAYSLLGVKSNEELQKETPTLELPNLDIHLPDFDFNASFSPLLNSISKIAKETWEKMPERNLTDYLPEMNIDFSKFIPPQKLVEGLRKFGQDVYDNMDSSINIMKYLQPALSHKLSDYMPELPDKETMIANVKSLLGDLEQTVVDAADPVLRAFGISGGSELVKGAINMVKEYGGLMIDQLKQMMTLGGGAMGGMIRGYATNERTGDNLIDKATNYVDSGEAFNDVTSLGGQVYHASFDFLSGLSSGSTPYQKGQASREERTATAVEKIANNSVPHEYHAEGGFVGGEGAVPQGTDIVPAMLTPHEFVVPEKAMNSLANNGVALQPSNQNQTLEASNNKIPSLRKVQDLGNLGRSTVTAHYNSLMESGQKEQAQLFLQEINLSEQSVLEENEMNQHQLLRRQEALEQFNERSNLDTLIAKEDNKLQNTQIEQNNILQDTETKSLEGITSELELMKKWYQEWDKDTGEKNGALAIIAAHLAGIHYNTGGMAMMLGGGSIVSSSSGGQNNNQNGGSNGSGQIANMGDVSKLNEAEKAAWETALIVGDKLGLPPEIFYGQFLKESGHDINSWHYKDHNLGGVKFANQKGAKRLPGGSDDGGDYAGWDSFASYADYFATELMAQSNFAPAIKAAQEAKAAGKSIDEIAKIYVQGIKAGGYFSGDLNSYIAEVTSIARTAPKGWSMQSAPTSGGGSNVPSNGSIPHYKQFDKQWSDSAWGDLTQIGCNPAALAILLQQTTGKTITPKDVANYLASQNIRSGNFGNAAIAGKHFGADIQSIERHDTQGYAQALELLKKGIPVMMGVGQALGAKSDKGHYVVAQGIDQATGKIIFNDPGKNDEYNKGYGAFYSWEQVVADAPTMFWDKNAVARAGVQFGASASNSINNSAQVQVNASQAQQSIQATGGNVLNMIAQTGVNCTRNAWAAITNAYLGTNYTHEDDPNWQWASKLESQLQAKMYDFGNSAEDKARFEQLIQQQFDSNPNKPIYLYQAGGAGSGGNHKLNRGTGTHATVIGRRLENGKYQVFDSNGFDNGGVASVHELDLGEIFDSSAKGGNGISGNALWIPQIDPKKQITNWQSNGKEVGGASAQGGANNNQNNNQNNGGGTTSLNMQGGFEASFGEGIATPSFSKTNYGGLSGSLLHGKDKSTGYLAQIAADVHAIAGKMGVAQTISSGGGGSVSPTTTPTAPSQNGGTTAPAVQGGEGYIKTALEELKGVNQDYYNWVMDYSKKYNVDPNVIAGIMKAESDLGRAPDTHTVNHAGAVGPMQILAQHWDSSFGDIMDDKANIEAGVKHYADILKMFNGDVQLALAGYNWGPYRKTLQNASNWQEIKDKVLALGNKETYGYVEKITGHGAMNKVTPPSFAEEGAMDDKGKRVPLDHHLANIGAGEIAIYPRNYMVDKKKPRNIFERWFNTIGDAFNPRPQPMPMMNPMFNRPMVTPFVGSMTSLFQDPLSYLPTISANISKMLKIMEDGGRRDVQYQQQVQQQVQQIQQAQRSASNQPTNNQPTFNQNQTNQPTSNNQNQPILSGGNDALEQAFQSLKNTAMDNTTVGCVEAVTRMGESWSDFLKEERQKGVLSVDGITADAKNKGIFEEYKEGMTFNRGDVIVWGKGGGGHGHVGIADGTKEGYYHNSSSSYRNGSTQHLIHKDRITDTRPIIGIIRTGSSLSNAQQQQLSSNPNQNNNNQPQQVQISDALRNMFNNQTFRSEVASFLSGATDQQKIDFKKKYGVDLDEAVKAYEALHGLNQSDNNQNNSNSNPNQENINSANQILTVAQYLEQSLKKMTKDQLKEFNKKFFIGDELKQFNNLIDSKGLDLSDETIKKFFQIMVSESSADRVTERQMKVIQEKATQDLIEAIKKTPDEQLEALGKKYRITNAKELKSLIMSGNIDASTMKMLTDSIKNVVAPNGIEYDAKDIEEALKRDDVKGDFAKAIEYLSHIDKYTKNQNKIGEEQLRQGSPTNNQGGNNSRNRTPHAETPEQFWARQARYAGRTGMMMPMGFNTMRGMGLGLSNAVAQNVMATGRVPNWAIGRSETVIGKNASPLSKMFGNAGNMFSLPHIPTMLGLGGRGMGIPTMGTGFNPYMVGGGFGGGINQRASLNPNDARANEFAKSILDLDKVIMGLGNVQDTSSLKTYKDAIDTIEKQLQANKGGLSEQAFKDFTKAISDMRNSLSDKEKYLVFQDVKFDRADVEKIMNEKGITDLTKALELLSKDVKYSTKIEEAKLRKKYNIDKEVDKNDLQYLLDNKYTLEQAYKELGKSAKYMHLDMNDEKLKPFKEEDIRNALARSDINGDLDKAIEYLKNNKAVENVVDNLDTTLDKINHPEKYMNRQNSPNGNQMQYNPNAIAQMQQQAILQQQAYQQQVYRQQMMYYGQMNQMNPMIMQQPMNTVGGALAGGILGSMVGGGKGRILTTLLGAIGGGLIGNNLDKKQRKAQEEMIAEYNRQVAELQKQQKTTLVTNEIGKAITGLKANIEGLGNVDNVEDLKKYYDALSNIEKQLEANKDFISEDDMTKISQILSDTKNLLGDKEKYLMFEDVKFDREDVKKIMNEKGITNLTEALKLLSKDVKYSTKIEEAKLRKKYNIDKEVDKNDLQYLLDNNYSLEKAYELLSKHGKYMHLDMNDEKLKPFKEEDIRAALQRSDINGDLDKAIKYLTDNKAVGDITRTLSDNLEKINHPEQQNGNQQNRPTQINPMMMGTNPAYYQQMIMQQQAMYQQAIRQQMMAQQQMAIYNQQAMYGQHAMMVPQGGAGIGGAIAGGLLGSLFGKGSGRLLMTGLGAIGGFLMGNRQDKKQRQAYEQQMAQYKKEYDEYMAEQQSKAISDTLSGSIADLKKGLESLGNVENVADLKKYQDAIKAIEKQINANKDKLSEDALKEIQDAMNDTKKAIEKKELYIEHEGVDFERNDIDYLINEKHAKNLTEALEILSKDVKYSSKLEEAKLKKKYNIDKEIDKNDLQYLLDNNYSLEQAMEELSKNGKYMHLDMNDEKLKPFKEEDIREALQRSDINGDLDKAIKYLTDNKAVKDITENLNSSLEAINNPNKESNNQNRRDITQNPYYQQMIMQQRFGGRASMMPMAMGGQFQMNPMMGGMRGFGGFGASMQGGGFLSGLNAQSAYGQGNNLFGINVAQMLGPFAGLVRQHNLKKLHGSGNFGKSMENYRKMIWAGGDRYGNFFANEKRPTHWYDSFVNAGNGLGLGGFGGMGTGMSMPIPMTSTFPMGGQSPIPFTVGGGFGGGLNQEGIFGGHQNGRGGFLGSNLGGVLAGGLAGSLFGKGKGKLLSIGLGALAGLSINRRNRHRRNRREEQEEQLRRAAEQKVDTKVEQEKELPKKVEIDKDETKKGDLPKPKPSSKNVYEGSGINMDFSTWKGGEYFNDRFAVANETRDYMNGLMSMEDLFKSQGIDMSDRNRILTAEEQQKLGRRQFNKIQTVGMMIEDLKLTKGRGDGLTDVEHWLLNGNESSQVRRTDMADRQQDLDAYNKSLAQRKKDFEAQQGKEQELDTANKKAPQGIDRHAEITLDNGNKLRFSTNTDMESISKAEAYIKAVEEGKKKFKGAKLNGQELNFNEYKKVITELRKANPIEENIREKGQTFEEEVETLGTRVDDRRKPLGKKGQLGQGQQGAKGQLGQVKVNPSTSLIGQEIEKGLGAVKKGGRYKFNAVGGQDLALESLSKVLKHLENREDRDEAIKKFKIRNAETGEVIKQFNSYDEANQYYQQMVKTLEGIQNNTSDSLGKQDELLNMQDRERELIAKGLIDPSEKRKVPHKGIFKHEAMTLEDINKKIAEAPEKGSKGFLGIGGKHSKDYWENKKRQMFPELYQQEQQEPTIEPIKQEEKKHEYESWKAEDPYKGTNDPTRVQDFKGGEYFNDRFAVDPIMEKFMRGEVSEQDIAKHFGITDLNAALSAELQQKMGMREFGKARNFGGVMSTLQLAKNVKSTELPVQTWLKYHPEAQRERNDMDRINKLVGTPKESTELTDKPNEINKPESNPIIPKAEEQIANSTDYKVPETDLTKLYGMSSEELSNLSIGEQKELSPVLKKLYEEGMSSIGSRGNYEAVYDEFGANLKGVNITDENGNVTFKSYKDLGFNEENLMDMTGQQYDLNIYGEQRKAQQRQLDRWLNEQNKLNAENSPTVASNPLNEPTNPFSPESPAYKAIDEAMGNQSTQLLNPDDYKLTEDMSIEDRIAKLQAVIGRELTDQEKTNFSSQSLKNQQKVLQAHIAKQNLLATNPVKLEETQPITPEKPVTEPPVPTAEQTMSPVKKHFMENGGYGYTGSITNKDGIKYEAVYDNENMNLTGVNIIDKEGNKTFKSYDELGFNKENLMDLTGQQYDLGSGTYEAQQKAQQRQFAQWVAMQDSLEKVNESLKDNTKANEENTEGLDNVDLENKANSESALDQAGKQKIDQNENKQDITKIPTIEEDEEEVKARRKKQRNSILGTVAGLALGATLGGTKGAVIGALGGWALGSGALSGLGAGLGMGGSPMSPIGMPIGAMPAPGISPIGSPYIGTSKIDYGGGLFMPASPLLNTGSHIPGMGATVNPAYGLGFGATPMPSFYPNMGGSPMMGMSPFGMGTSPMGGLFGGLGNIFGGGRQKTSDDYLAKALNAKDKGSLFGHSRKHYLQKAMEAAQMEGKELQISDELKAKLTDEEKAMLGLTDNKEVKEAIAGQSAQQAIDEANTKGNAEVKEAINPETEQEKQTKHKNKDRIIGNSTLGAFGKLVKGKYFHRSPEKLLEAAMEQEDPEKQKKNLMKALKRGLDPNDIPEDMRGLLSDEDYQSLGIDPSIFKKSVTESVVPAQETALETIPEDMKAKIQGLTGGEEFRTLGKDVNKYIHPDVQRFLNGEIDEATLKASLGVDESGVMSAEQQLRGGARTYNNVGTWEMYMADLNLAKEGEGIDPLTRSLLGSESSAESTLSELEENVPKAEKTLNEAITKVPETKNKPEEILATNLPLETTEAIAGNVPQTTQVTQPPKTSLTKPIGEMTIDEQLVALKNSGVKFPEGFEEKFKNLPPAVRESYIKMYSNDLKLDEEGNGSVSSSGFIGGIEEQLNKPQKEIEVTDDEKLTKGVIDLGNGPIDPSAALAELKGQEAKLNGSLESPIPQDNLKTIPTISDDNETALLGTPNQAEIDEAIALGLYGTPSDEEIKKAIDEGLKPQKKGFEDLQGLDIPEYNRINPEIDDLTVQEAKHEAQLRQDQFERDEAFKMAFGNGGILNSLPELSEEEKNIAFEQAGVEGILSGETPAETLTSSATVEAVPSVETEQEKQINPDKKKFGTTGGWLGKFFRGVTRGHSKEYFMDKLANEEDPEKQAKYLRKALKKGLDPNELTQDQMKLLSDQELTDLGLDPNQALLPDETQGLPESGLTRNDIAIDGKSYADAQAEMITGFDEKYAKDELGNIQGIDLGEYALTGKEGKREKKKKLAMQEQLMREDKERQLQELQEVYDVSAKSQQELIDNPEMAEAVKALQESGQNIYDRDFKFERDDYGNITNIPGLLQDNMINTAVGTDGKLMFKDGEGNIIEDDNVIASKMEAQERQAQAILDAAMNTAGVSVLPKQEEAIEEAAEAITPEANVGEMRESAKAPPKELEVNNNATVPSESNSDKAMSGMKASSGIEISKNDWDYLMNSGYTPEQAMTLLNQHPKYMAIDKKLLPEGIKEEDVRKAMIDRGLSLEDAINAVAKELETPSVEKAVNSTPTPTVPQQESHEVKASEPETNPTASISQTKTDTQTTSKPDVGTQAQNADTAKSNRDSTVASKGTDSIKEFVSAIQVGTEKIVSAINRLGDILANQNNSSVNNNNSYTYNNIPPSQKTDGITISSPN